MNSPAIWAPQPGSQELFLSCPVFEVLYDGTRGPGKTDALLMDFAQHVGEGFGQHWQGVIFRRTYPELQDIWKKAKQWFSQIFPAARSNISDHSWTFPDGEKLSFRHFERPDAYWSYHGHQYPFVGWEELTSWPTGEGYESMMSCCRSAHPGMPRKYRATSNPYGVGHNWVKKRFVDPAPMGSVIVDETTGENRLRIHGSLWENKILLAADPGYIRRLQMVRDRAKRAAWIEGSWDIPGGGMFDDFFDAGRHVARPFQIPEGWHVDRSFDWGSSAPFSVLWYAESNGEDVKDGDRVISVPRGTVFVISEWYGSTGEPNEGLRMLSADIARGIIERETRMVEGGLIPRAPERGPADSAIYTVTDGDSIGDTMARAGVQWIPSQKGRGSRVAGWDIIKARLSAVLETPQERPGLYFFDTCREIISHLPNLPRDKSNPDDIDTDAEDHDADALRYRLSTTRHTTGEADAPW